MGKIALEEFVDEYVYDKGLASKMLQMKELVHDTFFILKEKYRNNRIVARSESSGKTYVVEVIGRPEMYAAGRYFTGRIHPWHEDGTYRTIGIVKLKMSNEEAFAKYGLITNDMVYMIHDRMM